MTKTISKTQLARELLEQAASEWKKDIDYFRNEIDGSINFIFKVQTAYGSSIVYYNPQEAAEKVVEACRRKLERTELWNNERYRERFLRSQAGWAIRVLLTSACLHFEDSMWELPHVAITQYECLISTPDVRRELVEKLLKFLNERKKKRFVLRSRGRTRVVIDEMVYLAVEKFGGAPSQRKVAQFLKISEKALRVWRTSLGFPRWKDFLEVAGIGRK